MSVSTLVLLGLAVIWAIVLLPEAVKKLSGVRNSDSIRSFNHQLSSLQSGRSTATSPRSNVIDMRARSGAASRPVAPARSAEPMQARPVSPAVRRRRQEVLTVLGSAAVLTLLCTVAFGGPFMFLFLVSAGLLVGYVVLLHQVTNAPAVPARRTDGYVDGYAVHGPARAASGEAMGSVRVSPVSARSVAN
jgi:hypothetical protein